MSTLIGLILLLAILGLTFLFRNDPDPAAWPDDPLDQQEQHNAKTG